MKFSIAKCPVAAQNPTHLNYLHIIDCAWTKSTILEYINPKQTFEHVVNKNEIHLNPSRTSSSRLSHGLHLVPDMKSYMWLKLNDKMSSVNDPDSKAWNFSIISFFGFVFFFFFSFLFFLRAFSNFRRSASERSFTIGISWVCFLMSWEFLFGLLIS